MKVVLILILLTSVVPGHVFALAPLTSEEVEFQKTCKESGGESPVQGEVEIAPGIIETIRNPYYCVCPGENKIEMRHNPGGCSSFGAIGIKEIAYLVGGLVILLMLATLVKKLLKS